MAASSDELRQELAEHRDRISTTVDRIEDRVVPGRVVARGRQRVRDRFVDVRDRVMGHDPDDPWHAERRWPAGGTSAGGTGDAHRGPLEQGRELVGSAVHGLGEAPRMVRQRTQGAPLAAGLVAFAAGMVVGGVAPPTRREQDLTDRIDPVVGRAVDEARDAAQDVATQLRAPVRDAVDEVTGAARSGAGEVGERARSRPG